MHIQKVQQPAPAEEVTGPTRATIILCSLVLLAVLVLGALADSLS